MISILNYQHFKISIQLVTIYLALVFIHVSLDLTYFTLYASLSLSCFPSHRSISVWIRCSSIEQWSSCVCVCVVCVPIFVYYEACIMWTYHRIVLFTSVSTWNQCLFAFNILQFVIVPVSTLCVQIILCIRLNFYFLPKCNDVHQPNVYDIIFEMYATNPFHSVCFNYMLLN